MPSWPADQIDALIVYSIGDRIDPASGLGPVSISRTLLAQRG